MKLEKQVCSFTQAKKLAELSLCVDSLFNWKLTTEGSESISEVVFSQTEKIVPADLLPALTVAELGLLLPSVVQYDEDEDYYLQGSIGNREGEFYYIWFQSSLDNVEWELFPSIEKDTEAEARAEALIWLIENGYVDPKTLTL